MELPKRKHPRLKKYDYSQNGCYFVTVCVKNRKAELGRIIVGRDAHIPPHVQLTDIGKITERYIQNIDLVYPYVTVDKYVIMPDHVHLLIAIDDGGVWAPRPTLHTIIRSLKTLVTKQIGHSIWQDSYYDEIIRNEQAYCQAWQYIDGNPQNWQSDALQTP